MVAPCLVSAQPGRPDGPEMAAERSEGLQLPIMSPVAVFAQQAAPMGPGMAAELSKGSAKVRWLPRWVRKAR